MKVTLHENGEVHAHVDTGVTKEGAPMGRSWHCRDADQAGKLLPTLKGDDKQPAEHRISAGDASAVADAANEFRKQRDA